jgi:hypothetical protein
MTMLGNYRENRAQGQATRVNQETDKRIDCKGGKNIRWICCLETKEGECLEGIVWAFHDKSSDETRNRRNVLKIIKAIYDKAISQHHT